MNTFAKPRSNDKIPMTNDKPGGDIPKMRDGACSAPTIIGHFLPSGGDPAVERTALTNARAPSLAKYSRDTSIPSEGR